VPPTTPSPTAPAIDPAGRAGRPRDDAREQAILDAAIQLVAEVGYDRLTIDGVATRARASKATIYRRWPGKAELVVDAFKRRVPHPMEIPDLGSLRAELDHFMQLLCSHIGGIDGNLLCGLAGACHTDPDLAACFKRMVNEKPSPMRAVVTRAVARGELPEGSSHELIEEVVPAAALMRSLQGEPLDGDYIAHLVDDIAFPLLTSSPPSPSPTPSVPPTAVSPKES
jgi:AcrR family transcriptional regulator